MTREDALSEYDVLADRLRLLDEQLTWARVWMLRSLIAAVVLQVARFVVDDRMITGAAMALVVSAIVLMFHAASVASRAERTIARMYELLAHAKKAASWAS